MSSRRCFDLRTSGSELSLQVQKSVKSCSCVGAESDSLDIAERDVASLRLQDPSTFSLLPLIRSAKADQQFSRSRGSIVLYSARLCCADCSDDTE